jgi:hypothetical protein
MLKPTDVFSPGHLPLRPTNVYAARGEAERRFRTAVQRGMVPIVFGEYGVGKTSMARYVLYDLELTGKLVNIESAAGKTLQDVFSRCLEHLGYTVSVKRSGSTSDSDGHEQSGSAEAGFGGWLKAVVASKRTRTRLSVEQVEEHLVVTSPSDSKLVQICEEAGLTLLIDEVHRCSDGFRSDLAQFIKCVGNSNCTQFRVALLGTASEAVKLVESDPGIDRLLSEIHLRALDAEESRFIVTKGMADLSVAIAPELVERIVRTCAGSPSILQYLALEVAEAAVASAGRLADDAMLDRALDSFLHTRQARLNKAYLAATQSTGARQYRRLILHAVAEHDEDYVSMDMIRRAVSRQVGAPVSSAVLSSPLRELKSEKYGRVLADIERPESSGRMVHWSTFRDPALKAFVRIRLSRRSG